MPDFRAAADILRAAVQEHAFPGAAVEVGVATRPLWQASVGALTYDPDSPAVASDTIYDLASLTKVLATASIAMRAVEQGWLSLDDRLADLVPAWRGEDRSDVTVRDVLSHTSGLPAHAPLYRHSTGRAAFEAAIATLPLTYVPRSESLYSDLGFILLGFLLSVEGSLMGPFDTMWARIGAGEDLTFLPPRQWLSRTAPTEVDPWRGRLLRGEAHDENCFALGGVAGHAGLFGTAASVGVVARHLLQVLDGRRGIVSREMVAEFVARRTDVPGSSRALAWDTMLPTSSCGTRMSARAFGHTGYTGTSLWVDPEAGCYAVLLTNRVHPTRENNAIAGVRPAFHDAVMAVLGG